MAYLPKETKTAMDIEIKAIAKEYGLKVTTRREHHSSINLIIRSGNIDFEGDAIGTFNGYINQYYIDDNYKGKSAEVLTKFREVLYGHGYKEDSDAMTDYFNDSWYVSINLGEWNKPYIFTGVKDEN